MKYTIATYHMREMITMIGQQLLAVFWLFASQQGAAGFFLAPNHINRIRKEGTSDTSLLSSLEGEKTNEEPTVLENDLSMFIKSEAEEDVDGGFDPLEFFMTTDESIQKLEEVESFFREEPMGIMMEEVTGVVPSPEERTVRKKHIATTKPIPSDKIKMAEDADNIAIDEVPETKKVMFYDYDGSLSKIKGNLCDSPVIYYTE
mmetsp:Transcript_21253/g.43707  ORF Transcript_21253/g.43707 Transcript_21253/m.43707 type:complete len:203 (+) Transcript_21253:53-661(+)